MQPAQYAIQNTSIKSNDKFEMLHGFFYLNTWDISFYKSNTLFMCIECLAIAQETKSEFTKLY